MLLIDWKQARVELANGLKSHLQNSEHSFRAMESANWINRKLDKRY